MAMSDDEKAVQGIKDKGKRKAAFYTLQRRSAEAKGSSESRKIHSKLNLGDEARGFAKDTVDSLKKSGPIAGMFAAPEFRAAKALGGAAKAFMGGKKGTSLAEGAVQKLRTPTPVKKALGSGAKKLGNVANKGQKVAGAMPPKSLSGGSTKRLDSIGKPKPKALPSGNHNEFEAELSKMSKKGSGQKALPAYSKKPEAPKMSTSDIIKNREMRKAHAESKGEVYSRSKERTPRITTGTKPKTFNRDGSKNTRRDNPVNTTKSKKKSG